MASPGHPSHGGVGASPIRSAAPGNGSVVRGEFVDLGTDRVYYYAAGTRGAGEPVLLLHGFPTSSFLWSAVVPLVPAGHRVIVPDLLGFGRSDLPRPGRIDSDLSVGGHTDRTVQLLDALKVDRACIAGQGIGAAVALALAGRHPDRVTRLCLVNPVTAVTWPSRDMMLARALTILSPGLPSSWLLGFVRRALRRGSIDPARLDRSADHYLRPFRAANGRAVLRAHLRALTVRATNPPIRTTPAVPTAIVCGDRDPVVSVAAGQALRALLPHATVDIVTGGHYTPEESPEQVAAVLTRLLVDPGAG
jgi:pimeloyl-ACP methyl ester carboxylesterase